ncbi:hypothetical protein M0805_001220 [Coniferiporia weirii]|nr:hypothetical protein M0805_001220 [Coniferiporia weirii]
MISYVFHRAALYALLWTASIVELGLTGYRVRHTKSAAGFYGTLLPPPLPEPDKRPEEQTITNSTPADPIVVELLVTAALTLLWLPISGLAHLRKARDLSSGLGPLRGESAGNFVLWVMWLVGAAIATNKWPNKTLAGTGKEAHLLLGIVAFAWLPFAALSLAKVFVLMQYAAYGASSAHVAPAVREKA